MPNGCVADMRICFQDINFNSKLVSVDGDTATVSTQLVGTHTADLDLSMMGFGVHSGSGRAFSVPE